jgi:hypothetical protein
MCAVWYNPPAVSASHAADPDRGRRRYLRAPEPLRFPVEAEMPETRRHMQQRTALFQIVLRAFGDRATVGSEQFVYWDPTDPAQCCAPDLFVRLGAADEPFDSWKVWERGAPELVIEIVSPSDSAQGPWDRKLDRFRRLGAREVVRFDAEDARPVRIWDGIDGDLVERDGADPVFWRCDTLGAYFCVCDGGDQGTTLRLARDCEGRDLLPTPEEGWKRADEARQIVDEARRIVDEARQRAELRVAELEAELATRRGP